ncbi:MAG TPA: hypothetical protein VEJ36_01635 [Nitrososphaerales archaeon]|nr:hypothetical protein [Nitrososphaerales archaeon]
MAVELTVACVISVLTAPFWALDVVLVSFAALMITQFALRKADLPEWLSIRKPEVRSRVYRFAQIAKQSGKAGGRGFLLGDKSSVLTMSEIRSLSTEDLADLEDRMGVAG